MRIARRRVEAERVLEVRSPWDGAIVGTVPRASRRQVAEAFEIAAGYRPTLTRYQRQQVLLRAAALIEARKAELSDLITAELGICKKDSLYEAGRACDVFTLAGQAAILDDGEAFSCDITPGGKARRIFTTRDPLRAISAITPFNHPLNMPAHKIAPAIATNSCVVLKPTELTPLTALVLADILYDAGLPPEMLSVVTGLPADIGEEMITNPNIELVTFTGGVAVGKMIAEKAGYKRRILELGGNSELIVLDDADLEQAAELAVLGATKNSGQRCTAVKRVICLESVADDFVPLVVERARKIRYGDPMDPETDMGTVVHEQAARDIERRVDDAIAAGAELLYGHERRGALYAPTVLDRVPPDCELVREETFGPPIPVIRVKDLDQAIAVANATAFGLSAGLCTLNWAAIRRCIAELRTGTVNVWEVPGFRIEMSPFGGVKDSGLGDKEGVLEAMKAYTTVKTFSLPWG